MTKTRKIAVVLSGGATKCAYGAGVMLALAKEYRFTEPDTLISESGSNLTAFPYLSGQYGTLESGWLNIPSVPNFISTLRLPVMDIDFLIDSIVKKNYHLDKKALFARKTHHLVPLTRVRDGALVYYRSTNADDPYEVLRAGCAMPILFGGTVELNGERYVDGGFGSHSSDHVRHAVQEGATDVIYVVNYGGPTAGTRELLRAAAYIWKSRGMTGLAKASMRETKPARPLHLPTQVNLITLRPSQKSWRTIIGKNKSSMRRMMDLGYRDAVHNHALQKLLKMPP